jgi:transcription elongation factor Elf1
MGVKSSNMACPNCGTQLSCGCQVRTASNGTRVCTSCMARYEEQLKTQSQWKHAAVVITVDQNQ